MDRWNVKRGFVDVCRVLKPKKQQHQEVWRRQNIKARELIYLCAVIRNEGLDFPMRSKCIKLNVQGGIWKQLRAKLWIRLKNSSSLMTINPPAVFSSDQRQDTVIFNSWKIILKEDQRMYAVCVYNNCVCLEWDCAVLYGIHMGLLCIFPIIISLGWH